MRISWWLAWLSQLCLLVLLARAAESKSQVLVIVLDGFRQDYFDRYKLDAFGRLEELGTRVSAFIPEMPTQCYTNFYSLFTGNEPLQHGIVANNMIEASTGRTFLGGVEGNWDDASWWNKTEPIWVSAKRNEQRVALFSWPACELSVFGPAYSVDRCQPYREFGSELLDLPGDETANDNKNTSHATYVSLAAGRFSEDLAFAVDELRSGTEFVGVFTDIVDILGHIYGPDSAALGDALHRALEPALDQLLEALATPTGASSSSSQLGDNVNVIMLSDHGMSSLLVDDDAYTRTIDLSKFWRNSEIERTLDGGAYVGIYPSKQIMSATGGVESFISRIRSKISPSQRDAVRFLTRDEMIQSMQRWDSAEFLFSGSNKLQLIEDTFELSGQFVEPSIRERVAPIVAIAQPGWFLKTAAVRRVPRYGGQAARGWHGYDASNPEMWGLFLAFGPAFTPKRLVEANNTTGYLRARDAYLLIAELLGIEPMAHSGSRERVSFILANPATAVLSEVSLCDQFEYVANFSRVTVLEPLISNWPYLLAVACIVYVVLIVLAIYVVYRCSNRSSKETDSASLISRNVSDDKQCHPSGASRFFFHIFPRRRTVSGCRAESQQQMCASHVYKNPLNSDGDVQRFECNANELSTLDCVDNWKSSASCFTADPNDANNAGDNISTESGLGSADAEFEPSPVIDDRANVALLEQQSDACD